jgi:hypothetical protein
MKTTIRKGKPVTNGKKRQIQSHKNAKRILPHAEGSACFWVTDGQILSNLIELERALKKMTNDVFLYHVTKDKNDFADWVQYVLGDTELAGSLRSARRPTSACVVVTRRLKIYDV